MFSLLIGSSPPFRPISTVGPTFLPRARAPPSSPAWPPRPRPRPAPHLPLPRADAPVPTALRRSAPRGGRMPSTPVGWRPVAPPARALACLQDGPSAPSLSIRSLSHFNKPERLLPLATVSRSPAGEIRRWWSTAARNSEHTAPPRSLTPRARNSFTG
jgi:hypothetical protein